MTAPEAASSYRVTLHLEADRLVGPERVVELLAGRWCEGEDFDPATYDVRVLAVEEEG